MSSASPDLWSSPPEISQSEPSSRRLQADIVVGVEGVPEQRVRDRAARHAGRDRVGAVGRLLVVDVDLVEGRVRRHDAGADIRACSRLCAHENGAVLLLGDIVHGRSAVQPHAGARQAADQPVQVFERMEPALVREAQTAPAAEARDRRLIGPVDR